MQQRDNTDPGPPELSAVLAAAAMHGRILIVADEDALIDRLRGDLTPAGYDLETASAGQTALEAMDGDPPDLILMDAGLRGMDGYEATRRLKASDEARFIPIVVLVGQSDTRDKERCLEVGADDFITKPFTATELQIRVRSLLRLGRLHQDLADNNQELQAAYETARDSEAKYRALIYDAQDALFLIAPASATILEANHRARDLSGYDSDELIGQSAALLAPQDGWLDMITRVVAEGRISVEDGGMIRRKDGTDIPVEVQLSLANHHLSEPLIQALVRDLRPRRQLEAERNKSERLAAVVETAVTVNHEINNPLFVITSSVEALQRSLFDADSGVREKLDRISEACRRIQRFTKQLGSVIDPVSKEYMPGLKMLDLQQSVNTPASPEGEPGDEARP